MQLFYTPSLEADTLQFEFDPDESKHIVKVLRKGAGDTLQVTNGRGYLFEVRILEAHPGHCKAEVVSSKRQYEKHYRLHLAVAPTKNISRYEWFLEKATEIGVDEITPIICERSERNTVKSDRLKKIVEAAMKQSLRTFLPVLNPAVGFKDFVKQDLEGIRCIAHCENSEKTDLKRRIGADRAVTILIGPEGDFSREEIRLAREQGFDPISLGEARLRTETAAIVAAATVAIVNGG